jgi:hypothetical protein
VAGNDHIGQRQQAGKHIILDDFIRQILKKYVGFFLINI